MGNLERVDSFCTLDITKISSSEIRGDFSLWALVLGGHFSLLFNCRDSMQEIHLNKHLDEGYILYGISLVINRINSLYQESDVERLIEEFDDSFLYPQILEVMTKFDDLLDLDGKSIVLVLSSDPMCNYQDIILKAAFLSNQRMKYLHFGKEDFRVN